MLPAVAVDARRMPLFKGPMPGQGEHHVMGAPRAAWWGLKADRARQNRRWVAAANAETAVGVVSPAHRCGAPTYQGGTAIRGSDSRAYGAECPVGGVS